jgi:hypothetical protein
MKRCCLSARSTTVREKNAFLLAKLALEVDERMKKENQEYYWSFNTPFSNEGSSFPKM